MAEKNGEKVSLRWTTTILLSILMAAFGWFFTSVIYAELKSLQTCKLDKPVYYADKVFSENQMVKMRQELKDELDKNREERRQDIQEINRKLDQIIVFVAESNLNAAAGHTGNKQKARPNY